MNQKKIFSQPDRANGPTGPSSRLNIDRLPLVCTFALLMLGVVPDSGWAQGDFVPFSDQLPPPPTAHPTLEGGSELAPLARPPKRSFPDSAIPFDPNVRPADLHTPVEASPLPVDGSVESTFESTTNLLSSAKDGLIEKTSAWLTTLKQDGSWTDKFRSLFGSSDIGRMLGSLALVLGGYFTFVWLIKRINPGEHTGIPSEVIEVLGCVPFGPRKNLQLVRLGSKLLLLMNDAEGTRPIGEITDVAEVEYLTSLCVGKRKSSSRGTEEILRAVNRLKATRSSAPSPAPSPTPTPAPVAPTETMANLNTNLANILRSLESATRHHGTSFEA